MSSQPSFFSNHRRDLNEKASVSADSLIDYVRNALNDIQSNLYNQADKFRQEHTFTADSYEEFKTLINGGGFVRCGWDGTESTEKQIKNDTKATIRCIPFDEAPSKKKCILTGEKAKHEAIFAKAY